MGTKWEQSRNKNSKLGKNGNKVGIKWEQELPSGARMGIKWKQRALKSGARMVTKWEQSGSKTPKQGKNGNKVE